MGRILAIDCGKKRTGLAVSDPMGIIATGLTTLPTHELIPFLKKYIATEEVSRFVVGKPMNLDGSKTDGSIWVDQCLHTLKKHFGHIPVTLLDERFSSKMASQSLLDSGLKKQDRRNKALLDEVSATLLLQDYLRNS